MKSFVLISLMFCANFLFSQTTVTLGSSSGNSRTYTGIGAYWGYTRNASLYTSAEVGATGVVITSIQVYVSTSSATTIPLKIYMNTQAGSSISSSQTWSTVTSGATLVYDASTAFSSTGWTTIDITDFTYSSNNLLVFFESNYGGAGSGSYPYIDYHSSAGKGLTWSSDNSAPTGVEDYSGYRVYLKATYSSTPTVSTTSISSATSTSAASGGTISSIGGSAVTVSGICWNTSTNPTTANSKTTDGATSATSFSSNLSGLTAETYYYVRAYATNSSGTAYGSNVEFYTLSTEPSGHSASFTATATSASQINLSFSAASNYGADGYIILRLSGSTAPDNTNITDGTAPGSLSMPGSTVLVTTITNSATTSYSNTSLSANTQYSYAIIPFNYDGSNSTTYNYRTSATIPTCNATTQDGPSSLGVSIAGNIVNNGTLVQTNDVNYFSMTGSSKSITGSGTYTNTKLNVDGSITFDGTISSGSFSKTYVASTKSITINTSKTYKNGLFTNYGTTTLGSSSNFQNSGNWLNYGVVTANSSSTGTFNGSSAQTIGGNTSTSFKNLTISNTSGNVSLGINTTAEGTVTLTSGLLSTQGYTFTIGTTSANGAVSGGSSSAYIVAYDNGGTIGYVKSFVNTNTVYSFPIGDLTHYTPLTYTQASATLSSAYLTVYTKDSKVTGMNSSLTNYVDRFWEVTASGITSPTYTISYIYDDSDIVGSETNFKPVKKSGSTWYKPASCSFITGTEQGTGSVDAATNTLTWSSLTTFSLFGGAGDQGVALPIELLAFDAKKYQNDIKTSWKTASEINNDYFTVERSENGIDFDKIAEIDGAGNSTHLISYFYLDSEYKNGVNYYRLKQTDYNGNFSYSNIVAVDVSIQKGVKVMTVNTLGQEVNETFTGVVFDIFSDGTSVKRIQ